MTTELTKESMLPYVGHIVNDALDAESGAKVQPFLKRMRDEHGELFLNYIRIVGWTCGFKPMCVLVYPKDTR